jgi:hypothetical protein
MVLKRDIQRSETPVLYTGEDERLARAIAREMFPGEDSSAADQASDFTLPSDFARRTPHAPPRAGPLPPPSTESECTVGTWVGATVGKGGAGGRESESEKTRALSLSRRAIVPPPPPSPVLTGHVSSFPPY